MTAVIHLAQAWCVEQAAAAAPVFDEQADIVARMRIAAMRRIRRRAAAQGNGGDAQRRTGGNAEGFCIQFDQLVLQATVPVAEHVEQRKTGGQVLMHHLGTPDLMRAAFAQGQQTGAMVDLAIEQDDAGDGSVTQLARWLQRRKGLDLRTDVRRGIAQDPLLTVIGNGDGRLRARLRPQGTGTHAVAVAAVAVPLGKAAASGGTENLDMHGSHQRGCPGRAGARSDQRLAKYMVTSKPMRRSV